MKYTFNPEDLTKERSLHDVYKLTKKIKVNSFDFYFTLLLVILSVSYTHLRAHET